MLRFFPFAVLLIACACSQVGSDVPGSTAGASGAPTTFRVGVTTVTVTAGFTPGAGCSATQVTSQLQDFLSAFNAGDETVLPSFFGRSLTFSEGGGTGSQGGFFLLTGGTPQLLGYFASLHAKHESRRLVNLQLTSYQSQGDRIDFGYDIQRTGDAINDLAPGKGSMTCATRTIDVWNMGSGPATAAADPYGWIDAAAARRIATVVMLIDAYNASDMASLQALLSPEVAAWADCAGDKFVTISGELGRIRPMTKAETISYFEARFTDHDRLEIGQVTTLPCSGGGDCVGIRFARRSNDSLRALGFSNGIVGPQTNKTVFDENGLVRAFANASGPQDCHPV